MHISSDSIGNKGIKKLTQLDLPKLAMILIGNTNITTDTIKVMKKQVSNGLLSIGIIKQRKFDYDKLFKEVGYFKLT